jgi:hypothetical protein
MVLLVMDLWVLNGENKTSELYTAPLRNRFKWVNLFSNLFITFISRCSGEQTLSALELVEIFLFDHFLPVIGQTVENNYT